jgi:hypothetical protein
MNHHHPSTWTDDELLRLPALSVPPEDPDPFCYVDAVGQAWQVGRHGGMVWVRGPMRNDDPVLE